MGRPSRFSPEVRERAVRMVEEHREAHASEWAVLQSVAPKLGCTAETLRKWVRQVGHSKWRFGMRCSMRSSRVPMRLHAGSTARDYERMVRALIPCGGIKVGGGCRAARPAGDNFPGAAE